MAMMTDTNMDDAWIQAAMKANPPQRVRDAAGNLTDQVLSGIVRFAFCENPSGGLLTPNSPRPDPKTGQVKAPQYSTILMWPPGTDLTPMKSLMWEIQGKEFPEKFHAATQSYLGLHNPFHPQSEKAQYQGFTPGGEYLTATANVKFKPSVVDSAFNPVVNEDQCRSGIWAVVMLNAYHYGKNPPQPTKGVGFGLLSVMIMQQDKRLGGGGAVDPKQAFKGVISTPAVADPNAMFAGQAPAAAPPPYPGQAQTEAPAYPQPAPRECFLCGTMNPPFAAACSACGNAF